jgi:hypothetical protein
MLKPADLRIGNIVKCGEQLLIISALNETCLSARNFDNHKYECAYGYEMIQGVEQSEGWLLKFGGVESPEIKGVYYFNNGNVLCDNAGNFALRFADLSVIIIRRCEYIHELHNLYFAIKGEELTTTELVLA